MGGEHRASRQKNSHGNVRRSGADLASPVAPAALGCPIRLAGWKKPTGGTRSAAEMGPASSVWGANEIVDFAAAGVALYTLFWNCKARVGNPPDLIETVAHTEYGFERERIVELFAELTNVHINRALVAIPANTPNAIE